MNQNLKIILLIDFAEGYGRALLRGITHYAQVHGPWSFCKMPPFIREKYGVNGIVKFARQWEAQGLVGQLYNNEIQKLIDSGLSIVAQDFKERFSQIPNITGNYEKTGELAAEYFLSKGFRNFAYYGFEDVVWSRERVLGYQRRLNEKGYEVSTFSNFQNKSHQLWYYNISPLTEWLKNLPKPLALFACDDNQGSYIIDCCNLAGIRIPDEVAILGVDNDEMVCNMTNPPLSSICLDTENAGYKVGQMLENMILKKEVASEDIMVDTTTIITRQSTDIFALNDPEVLKALHFIRNNLSNKIQVSDVVKKIPLSRRALEIRFMTAIGRSIYKEILLRKMEKAVRLLLKTQYSIFEIAVQCGFDDDKNFARMFQKTYHTTPVKYRKQFANIH